MKCAVYGMKHVRQSKVDFGLHRIQVEYDFVCRTGHTLRSRICEQNQGQSVAIHGFSESLHRRGQSIQVRPAINICHPSGKTLLTMAAGDLAPTCVASRVEKMAGLAESARMARSWRPGNRSSKSMVSAMKKGRRINRRCSAA